jgi:hypothetical protein
MERKPQMDYRETADKGETVAKDGDARKCGSNIHRLAISRVIPFMSKYFRGPVANLQQTPLARDEGAQSRARAIICLMAHGYTHHEHPTAEAFCPDTVQSFRASRYFWEDG